MEQIEDIVSKPSQRTSRVLVVSPHLDDAVLSIGATIGSLTTNKSHVTVFTVFAGVPDPPFSPAARRIHETWGLHEGPVHARRAEDVEALQKVKAKPLHGDFLDLIYRIQAENVEAIFEYSNEEYNSKLTDAIADSIERLIEQQNPDVVLTCAAIGGHTDHRHARDATIAACANAGVQLFLWEDIPYFLQFKDVPDLPANTRLGDQIIGAYNNECAFDQKYHAIECYASQQPELWQGQDFRALLDDYATTKHAARGCNGRAESLWKLHRM